MTNDPANIAAALRTLAVYAVCAILAVILGVLMTNPMTYSSLGFIAVLCSFLLLPLLLRWHLPLMVFAWATPIYMFFIKGDPKLALVMIALSIAISVVERTLNQPRFIRVPQVRWPLIALIVVVVITAKFTGGIGLRAFGSDVYGGKKYVFFLVGILGYFAMTAVPIPTHKARLYATLFFLGGALGFIGDLYPLSPGFLHPLFWFIPPEGGSPNGFEFGTTRLVGTGWAATSMVSVLIVRYGLRGIFLEGKLWRPVVLFLSIGLIFLGGFRSALLLTGATILLQFFLEGLHRTKLMPFFVILTLATLAAVIPLGSKLPFTFQRTLAFLPRSMIHLSTDARLAAQDSTNWRLQMWQALLPQIPKHLLLGKGYAITSEDFESMGADASIHSIDPAQQGLALSSDYHNGPLSVILPFGIWGVLAFTWFLVASMRVVYLNFQYGDPALKNINTFLFTSYVIATVGFIVIFGDLGSGMAAFTGLLGLSVAINKGVCRAPVRARNNIPFGLRIREPRVRPQPAFQPSVPGKRAL